MKLLVVSDEESRYIWDCFDSAVFGGVDLILSCGDLKREYLDFLVSMIPAPLFFVRGNHDESFLLRPPEGCVCVDGRVRAHKGIRVAGLGGCRGGRGNFVEFTDSQMEKRVSKLHREIRRAGGIDIFLTHAPAAGHGDGSGYTHRGFEEFLTIIDAHQPPYYFFGHQHRRYNTKGPFQFTRGATQMLNACGYLLIEYNKRM